MLTLEDLTEEKVLRETNKLLYLYTLKHVIRYGQNRAETDYTESVAEHIYGMHIIADYFRPLEDPNQALNMEKVYQLITWHELAEIETGDIVSHKKTAEDRRREAEMLDIALDKVPSSTHAHIESIVYEYEKQKTKEARFTKAIDKIEPLVHSFHPLGKIAQHEQQQTVELSRSTKADYIADYPYIERFTDTLHDVMDKEGYFYQGK